MAKKVGAHSPTKMPKRSAFALSSPFLVFQMAMLAPTEAKPSTYMMSWDKPAFFMILIMTFGLAPLLQSPLVRAEERFRASTR